MISDKRLNNSIKKVATMKVVVANISRTTLLDILQELKQRRESDLRPATKFVSCCFEKHIEKIQEEFFEVMYASRCGMKADLVEEIVDLQMACETALAGIGLDETQRMEARRKVIHKNQERGYYIAKGD